MILFLYLCIMFLNLVFAFRKRSSKLLTLITLSAILLFKGGAGPEYTEGSDFLGFEILYNNVVNIGLFENKEIGYTLLMKAGNLLNLDFFSFRMIIIAICLLLIHQMVIKRYVNNTNYILLLYMIFPMIIDSETFRNFIAMTVFLISIRFLESNSVKSRVKFIIVLMIAISIHTSFIFYLPLVLASVSNKSRLIKGITLVTICLIIVTFLNNNSLPIISLVNNLFDDARAESYLNTTTRWGFLFPLALQLINIIMITWSRKIIYIKDSETSAIDEVDTKLNNGLKRKLTDIELLNLIWWINIFALGFTPFYMMTLHFRRLGRNILFLNFIAYCITSNRIKKGSGYKLFFNSLVIVSVILWLVIDLTIMTLPERVLIPFLTRNVFFL